MRAGEWFFTNRPLCGRPTLPNPLLGFKRTAVSAALQVWSFEIRLNVRWGDFEREGTKSPRAGFPGPGAVPIFLRARFSRSPAATSLEPEGSPHEKIRKQLNHTCVGGRRQVLLVSILGFEVRGAGLGRRHGSDACCR